MRATRAKGHRGAGIAAVIVVLIVLLFVSALDGRLCVTEFVNALLDVAHHKQVIFIPRQSAEQGVLGGVAVLILVHHNVPKPSCIFSQNFRMIFEKFHRF